MGAWGIGHFDNDGALDWVGDLSEGNDLTLITDMIEFTLNEDYIESDDGEEILMALEAVARLRGNFNPNDDAYSEAMNTWVKEHPLAISDTLLASANKALDKLRAEDTSELYELWEDEDLTEWLGYIDELKSRLV